MMKSHTKYIKEPYYRINARGSQSMTAEEEKVESLRKITCERR
jgi:hypothetical protein